MLAGFFEGIVHDRKLMRQAEVNIAIRWFAGYELGQRVPHHSSLTRIRQRWGPERFKRIFQRTVAACMQAGLVDAETVHVDATLMRANVSWESLTEEHADSVLEQDQESAEQDEKPGPKAGTRRRGRHPKRRRRTSKKRSSTDPDASMTTPNSRQRMEPRYKQHTAVDGKSGVILDAETTTGEASEGSQLLDQVERIEETTGSKITTLTADAGYSSGRNYEALEQRGTEPVIPPQRRGGPRHGMPLERFTYDGKHETVRCPGGKMLKRGCTTQRGTWYRARRADCAGCRLRLKCVPATAKSRSVPIAVGYAALLRARRRRGQWSQQWREAYRGHRCRVEGVHGEAKTQHGLGRAVRWGLANMAIQAYLTAAVINLKRLAAFHWRSVCGPGWARRWFHRLLHSADLLRRLLRAHPSAIMPPTPAQT